MDPKPPILRLRYCPQAMTTLGLQNTLILKTFGCLIQTHDRHMGRREAGPRKYELGKLISANKEAYLAHSITFSRRNVVLKGI